MANAFFGVMLVILAISAGVRVRSNHEEAVGAVAPQLLDKAEFPIEIGLHLCFRRVGALIGPAIAMRGIGLWQHDWRARFERAVIAAVEHVNLPAHLREP